MTPKLKTVRSRVLAKDSCILMMCLASSQSIYLPVLDVDLHQEKSKFSLPLFPISVGRQNPLGQRSIDLFIDVLIDR